jgi:nitroreductase
MTDKEKYVYENILERRSIRRYKDKPVEKDKIKRLLEAAMAAPSACNIQPWEFIVVTETEIVQSIREIADHGKYNAPLIIAVCGNPKYIPWPNDEGKVDCAAAIQNMMLMATSMGLGSVWVGGFDSNALKNILDIPDGIYPIGLAYFGYPDENQHSRTQFTSAAVHWEKYDNNREQTKREGCLV